VLLFLCFFHVFAGDMEEISSIELPIENLPYAALICFYFIRRSSSFSTLSGPSKPPSPVFARSPKCSRKQIPVYSWDEIRKHNSRESCWLVVKGKVYDVTEFIPLHPAGEKAILRHAGQDSTEDFLFHSPQAQKLWDPYCIGSVEGADAGCIIL